MRTPWVRTALAAAAASFSSLTAAAVTHFDAALSLPLPASETRSVADRIRQYQSQPSSAPTRGSGIDARWGVPTFMWAPDWIVRTRNAPLAGDSRIDAAARDYLRQQASVLGLSGRLIESAQRVDIHDTGRGPVIARYQQMDHGVEVFGRQINVLMNRDLALVATTGYFAPEASSTPGGREFRLGAAQALVRAFADQGGKLAERDLRVAASDGRYQRFEVRDRGHDLHLTEGLRARKVSYPLSGALVPAWYVEFFAETRDGHDQRAFAYVISAQDGSVLFRKNLTDHAEAFSYRVFANTAEINRPSDSPLGSITSPSPVSIPGESIDRVSATAALVTLKNSPFTANDPWLTDSATVTSGNNVNAYLDLNAPGGYTPARNDVQPAVTATRTFDYPIAADVDPATSDARNAAAVNLFYVNNWLHDQTYEAGFDELAGNAQTDNYGRGGEDGDAIRAEGQDFSGTNNANMSTPADGGSPRMQMYLFDGLLNGSLTVLDPAEIGELSFTGASFGPQTYDLTGTLVAYEDGTEPTTDACEASVNESALEGNIVLLDRGNCDFVLKVSNAQDAGALGVVVANNVEGAPITMGGEDTGITIPAVMVSLEDGSVLRGTLAQGVTLNMQREEAIALDGTFDNEIIAHEFMHYVSNRLVGNASGLSNSQGQGMGEGWSDFASLLLSVLEGDQALNGNQRFSGGYTVGSYVLGNYYYGIRRVPFSTDFAKNPLTFQHITDGVPLPTSAPISYGQDGADNSEVHNTGEIWANTLWEVYVGFLNDPRYSYVQAVSKALDYMIAALKLTPNAPTFLEARDAWLAVALASDVADYQIVSTAFAKRGMGVNAIAPDRESADHAGAVEDFQAAAAYSLGATSVDLSYRDDTQGYCDTDPVLDAGEYGFVSLTIHPIAVPKFKAGPIDATISGSAGLSFPEGSNISFIPSSNGSSATASVAVLADLALVGTVAELSVAFQPADLDQVDNVIPASRSFQLGVNSDLVLEAVSDDVEGLSSTAANWSAVLRGTGTGWSAGDFESLTGEGRAWYAPVSATQSDAYLTSLFLDAGPDGLSLAADHLYDFPAGSRGVVEVRVKGGSWLEVAEVTGSNQGLETVSINLGAPYVNQPVQLRFRVSSTADVQAGFGWLLDNFRGSGATSKPLYLEVAEDGVCVD